MSSSSPRTTTGPEQAAVRKVIYQLAELDGTETDDMDIIEATNEAVETVEDLTERVADLEAQVEVLEDRAPSPDDQTYQEMDRMDKAAVVESKLQAEADATNGTAQMSYTDVVRVFDGRPSAGHAYDIMETAATADGISLGQDPDGQKRITYDDRRVND